MLNPSLIYIYQKHEYKHAYADRYTQTHTHFLKWHAWLHMHAYLHIKQPIFKH